MPTEPIDIDALNTKFRHKCPHIFNNIPHQWQIDVGTGILTSLDSNSGDVIVGFPGETDEEFQRTIDLMNEVKFDNLNTFAYSPRPNTEAALWDNQVPDDVKAERLQIIQRVAAQHGMERSERYVGQTILILVQDRNP